jgi:hypothetical protein
MRAVPFDAFREGNPDANEVNQSRREAREGGAHRSALADQCGSRSDDRRSTRHSN